MRQEGHVLNNFKALVAVEAVFIIMTFVFAYFLRRPLKSIIDTKTLVVFF